MKVAVIGGGAAGFFAAIAVKQNHPNAEVVILEKSQKLLAKVKVSGGGRCNVTNGCASLNVFSKAYPRGSKQLKKAFQVFNNSHTVQWFEKRGVPLYVQEDGRMFPVSDSSQSIIDCLMSEADRSQVRIEKGVAVRSIRSLSGQLELEIAGNKNGTRIYDKVIVASGGSPDRSGLEWLAALGHTIVDPVPSLFTFNMPNEPITELMGVVAENALVNIQGTKLKSSGPLLITHWGMSGPAILTLSAFGARTLHQMNYDFNAQVNWVGEMNNEVVMEVLQNAAHENPNKLLLNHRPYAMPERLWLYLLQRSALSERKKWNELGKHAFNKLVSVLTNDVYAVKGKTTFKEEFVTSGGVSLASIDFSTMQSRACKNLYFAGEVMDVDGITGGYNFQAAWTTGFIAGKLG